MQGPATQSQNKKIKQDVFEQFQLNRDVVTKFQQPVHHDPSRDPANPRTQALLKIWTAFELYKVQTLKNYMRQDARADFNAEAREQSFAYYDTVQDVMRALIHGATFSNLLSAGQTPPELQDRVTQGNVYAESLALLTEMTPPQTVRGMAIQMDLARLLAGFMKSDGDLAAVEKQIDPHLPVSDAEDLRLALGNKFIQAREDSRGGGDFRPD